MPLTFTCNTCGLTKQVLAQVESVLKEKLQASDVQVVDTSGGCGSSFEVAVVSEQFTGKKLLERHRLVST